MTVRYSWAAGLVALTACAPVTDETRSTIDVEGSTYELRTRTLDGPNGPFQQSSVKVKNKYYICLPDSPGDCAAAVKLARTESRGDG